MLRPLRLAYAINFYQFVNLISLIFLGENMRAKSRNLIHPKGLPPA
jgi:hypothetical protein